MTGDATTPNTTSETIPISGSSNGQNGASNNVHYDTKIIHKASDKQKEIGGRESLNPTRYGDWERNGRCVDF